MKSKRAEIYTFLIINLALSVYSLELALDNLTDQQIIETADNIIKAKSKNPQTFIELTQWIINECYSFLHPNYKKFCLYFILKQSLPWKETIKYNIYREEIVFILNTLVSRKINYSKNTQYILLHHINTQTDKDKLKLLKLLSHIDILWSFLLFIKIKESSLTISRYKEKLIARYTSISDKNIKVLFNSFPYSHRHYLLIYLFNSYKNLIKKDREKSMKNIFKTILLFLRKKAATVVTQNYYLLWQVAIRYLPTYLLQKLLDEKLLKDRKILSYLIYYKRSDIIIGYIKDKRIINLFTIETDKNYNKQKLLARRCLRNRTILKSLLWLWANQEEDGKWIASKHNPFHGNFNLPFFEGYEDLWYDIAETSLSIIAFTSCGFHHKFENIFGQAVNKAIRWIIKNQNRDGLIDLQESPYEFISGQYREPFSRSKHGSIRAASLYNHNISLYALTILFLMTKDRKLFYPLRKAYYYALRIKYPLLGIPKALNLDDIGPAVFAIIPLVLLHNAKIFRNNTSIEYIKKYIKKMEEDETGQVHAFSPVPRCLGNFDSVATLLTIKGLLGIDKEKSPSISKALKFLYNHPPRWNPFYKIPKKIPKSIAEGFFNDDDIVNEFYWLFASTAFKFYDNEWFIGWYNRLAKILRFHQRAYSINFGSFDPEGPWAKAGGRVYMTTMSILILQSPFLFNKIR